MKCEKKIFKHKGFCISCKKESKWIQNLISTYVDQVEHEEISLWILVWNLKE